MNQLFPSTSSFPYSEKELDVNWNQLKTYQEAKNCLKSSFSLFSRPFRIVESGRREVLLRSSKSRKSFPTPLQILGNCSVTIVAVQLLQLG